MAKVNHCVSLRLRDTYQKLLSDGVPRTQISWAHVRHFWFQIFLHRDIQQRLLHSVNIWHQFYFQFLYTHTHPTPFSDCEQREENIWFHCPLGWLLFSSKIGSLFLVFFYSLVHFIHRDIQVSLLPVAVDMFLLFISTATLYEQCAMIFDKAAVEGVSLQMNRTEIERGKIRLAE